jgi:hypothetical protein
MKCTENNPFFDYKEMSCITDEAVFCYPGSSKEDFDDGGNWTPGTSTTLRNTVETDPVSGMTTATMGYTTKTTFCTTATVPDVTDEYDQI